MLTSLAIILLCGLFLSILFQKLKLPGLIGMIIAGAVIGPYALDLLDQSILNIAGDLRQIALVIILTRAGLSLNINDLKKVGRPAILMCFIPAILEITGYIVIGPLLFNISISEAALMGSVIAAVSPAVIVPRMIKLIDEGFGKEKSIPQLILAGASVDDVFVIVAFTAFTTLVQNNEFHPSTLATIPISIILGIAIGLLVGLLLVLFFRKFHFRDSIKVIIIISVSFLLLELQNRINATIPFSGLIAIMCVGIAFKQKYDALAVRIQTKYNKLWVGAEIILFVLVGSTLDLSYALNAGLSAVIIILCCLIFRTFGVLLCLLKTKLSKKERLFCVIAYMPKATVQAAIGAVPLSLGLPCGSVILTVAVISIIITAPLGAILIDNLYKKLL